MEQLLLLSAVSLLWSTKTDRDRLGVYGLLSPRQIAIYHHDVFAEYGLPPTTFGGTPMTGDLWVAIATGAIWCWGCD